MLASWRHVSLWAQLACLTLLFNTPINPLFTPAYIHIHAGSANKGKNSPNKDIKRLDDIIIGSMAENNEYDIQLDDIRGDQSSRPLPQEGTVLALHATRTFLYPFIEVPCVELVTYASAMHKSGDGRSRGCIFALTQTRV